MDPLLPYRLILDLPPPALLAEPNAAPTPQHALKPSEPRDVPARSSHDSPRTFWLSEHPGFILRAANRDGSRSDPELHAALGQRNALAKEHDAAAALVYKRAVPTSNPKPAREPAETSRPAAPPALA